MTELSGTLDGVGLPAIVRFLIGLKKSGSLRVSHQDWQGEIFFDDGRLTGASLGARTGLSALDAVVECMPGASFAFESKTAVVGEPTIRLSQDALLAHLDELAAELARGVRKLPPVDGVPRLIETDEITEQDPLPLDSATLQTLVAVDGQRNVREIVAQRGTFDALWQLASLVEVGLVEVPAADGDASAAVETDIEPEVAAAPVAEDNEPLLLPPAIELEEPQLIHRCPKLGFDDDPDNSFGRPTRLHRCFAAGTPLPLALDQQRELCLSDQFAICPRLTTAVASPADAPVRPNSKGRWQRPPKADGDDPRIVRLPFVARNSVAEREAVGGAAEPTRLRAANGTAGETTAKSSRLTPLRSRMERAASTRAAVEPAPTVVRDTPPVRAPEAPARQAVVPDAPAVRRFGGVSASVIAGLGVVVVIIAAIAYLLLPQMDALFVDDSIDTSALPNSSRVAAGTPVSAITSSRSASNAAAQPTVVQPSAAQPTAATAPTQASAQPTVAPVPTPGSLLDERFANNDLGWPSYPQGTAWISNGTYRIVPRQAGQFVAIGAPVTGVPNDVVVNATFRKVGGPAGGGYGIILRDQGPGVRDGLSQDGRYYVLEAGDKGEVGIWRRDGDHWVDLLAWQHSDAVKTGAGINTLTVRAIGSTLSLSVNGTEVATRTDNSLIGGSVGLFVGGDGNQVAVDRFTIQTP